MNEKNLAVLTNIIGAVETGGQVYGKKRYNDYTAPYTNSKKEVTCTLGWYQAYGHEARQLIQEIYNTDTVTFWRLDSADIEEMLRYDWVALKWKPNAKEKAALIALIDSDVGHMVQDRIFAEKMIKLIEECEHDYTKDVKAQMMYCEIRHLGGKGPADRIFQRCAGKYDLDMIMASLVADQRDKSSDNQVGDTKYWSRHLKCREFIDRYAEDENMSVIIGSARGDEYGGSGWDGRAKAGDQKQTSKPDYKGEVSRQEWYLHSKGWYTFRAKDPAAREEIALNTEEACDNENVGYDQSENRTLLAEAKKVNLKAKDVKKKTETDCGQLQLLGILRAGIQIEDFYTANMKEKIEKTGKFYVFTDDAHCKSSDRLIRGDLQVTRSKGHAICVLSDGKYAAEERAKYDGAAPAPTPTTTGTEAVKALQRFLNQHYPTILREKCGGLLTIDGAYGKRSRLCALAVWKYMSNKYYKASLTPGNGDFGPACKAVAAKMTDAEVTKHPTLGYLIQGILAGRGYYTAKLDGVCGAKTQASIKLIQKAKGLSQTGTMSAETWNALFN